MLHVELNDDTGIATLTPDGALAESDFITATNVIDSYLEKTDKLNGIIIHTKQFPGWDSFASLMKHFKFVKDHHKKVSHVAVVTDSVIGDFAEKIVAHFIAAEIRHFAFDDLNKARDWILNTNTD